MIWTEYLNQWIKNKSEILKLQEFFGYLLLNDCFDYPKALVLKDVQYRSARFPICLVAEELVGEENVCSVDLERFDNNFSIQWFERCVLNIATENVKYNECSVKAVIRHEPLQINDQYKGFRQIKPISKHIIFYSEELESLIKYNNSKFLIINLETVEWLKEEVIEELINDIENIKKWAIEGGDRLIKQKGFTE